MRSLGFSDVRITDEANPGTTKFSAKTLPRIADAAARRFERNRGALRAYVDGEIGRWELYREIGSPAGGSQEAREMEGVF